MTASVGPVADVFRMLHPLSLARAIGWAVSKTDNRGFAYHSWRAGVAQLVEQRFCKCVGRGFESRLRLWFLTGLPRALQSRPG